MAPKRDLFRIIIEITHSTRQGAYHKNSLSDNIRTIKKLGFYSLHIRYFLKKSEKILQGLFLLAALDRKCQATQCLSNNIGKKAIMMQKG